MRHESEIRSRLARKDIFLSEHLGQHILVDEGVLSTVASQIDQGSNVLEIGSGSGNLTERIASRARKVVGIEIDRRFQPLLDEVQSSHPNIDIIYKDALSVNFKKIVKGGFMRRVWQIASNLPFHISEPFLQKIADLPIKDATLVVGDQLARKMQIESPEDPEFSRTSLITQTFFEPSMLSHIRKGSFYPQPRTDASLVSLCPRDRREFESNLERVILRNLFLSERKSPTVAKVIKESTGSGESRPVLSKTENHRQERRQSRQKLRQLTQGWQPEPLDSENDRYDASRGAEVDKLDLPREILNKPFARLDNQDLRILARALKRRYG